MNLLFLGTSSGWPFPRLGCDCKICTSGNPKDKRLRPSLLVNGEILLDCPPDIYHQLIKFNLDPTHLKYIILTHSHYDHIIGLYDLSRIYRQQEKIKLICKESILTQVRKILPNSLASFEIILMQPFEKKEIEKDKFVWLLPVEHGKIEAYAIKIKAPKPIIYAPEFRKIPPASKKFFKDIDVAIFDGASKTRIGRAKGHQTVEEGIKVGKELNCKKIVFTNIGHKTERFEELRYFVKNKGGNKFDIAYDGLEITL